ncbi:MAG TPA: hypothetical protein PLZ44_03560, partial [Methanothrix sp.]|nr:hypothetical protein [Methanothrix sp.]
ISLMMKTIMKRIIIRIIMASTIIVIRIIMIILMIPMVRMIKIMTVWNAAGGLLWPMEKPCRSMTGKSILGSMPLLRTTWQMSI